MLHDSCAVTASQALIVGRLRAWHAGEEPAGADTNPVQPTAHIRYIRAAEQQD